MPKILIVDDSSFQRRMIRRALGPLALDTIEAGDGRAAIELVQQESPDVILLDLLMPELDGFQVLAELQKEHCPIPRVVLTADEPMSRAVDGNSTGGYRRPADRRFL